MAKILGDTFDVGGGLKEGDTFYDFAIQSICEAKVDLIEIVCLQNMYGVGSTLLCK